MPITSNRVQVVLYILQMENNHVTEKSRPVLDYTNFHKSLLLKCHTLLFRSKRTSKIKSNVLLHKESE